MRTSIADSLLHFAGFLLLVSSVFEATVVTSRAHDHTELLSMVWRAAFMSLSGIGFLLPRLAAKLVSSLALVSAAAWLFCHDAYKLWNWWIYCLVFVPLLLTLPLRHRRSDLPIRSLPHGH